MRKIQLNFWIFGLLAAICCFAFTSAHASRDPVPLNPVPEMMRGIWAAPDCFAPEEWHFYSAYFRFYTAGDGIRMSSAAKLHGKTDYDVIGFDSPRGGYMPARVLEDGVMQMVRLERGARLAEGWEELDAASYQEFMHCLDIALPQGFADLMTASAKLDSLYPLCRDDIGKTCSEKLFTLYMPGGRTSLAEEELRDILKDAALFGGLNAPHHLSRRDIEVAASALMRAADADASGDISLAELQAVSNLWKSAALAGAPKQHLQQLLKGLLPYFPALETRG